MEIKINQEEIAESINKSIGQSIADALTSYDMQKSISHVISKEIAEGAIAEAIRIAASSVDVTVLSISLASEIQKATTKAVMILLQEALLTTVCTLRGIGDYSEVDKKARELLKAELFS